TEAATGIERYGDLKVATAQAVIELLRPVQARYHELAADPAETSRLLAVGADKARTIARATLDRAHQNLGLLAP
ncbi:MAG: tryptophan--tRNA ligase, partial [Acidimicrobiales bacterium]